jgi:hypothetical protein
VITYFKSRFLAQPIVYVEQDGGWKSYAPSGVIRQNSGPLPDFIRQSVDEVPLAEAIDLIHAYEAAAERAEAERYTPSPVSGLGGWLAVMIVLMILGCLSTILFIVLGLAPLWRLWDELTNPASPSYHAFFAPYIAYASFVNIFMVVAPIFLLVLMFKKKRVLPQIIIYVFVFGVFASVIDFVAVVAFFTQFLADRSLLDEARSLVIQGMVMTSLRGVGACGIWIPYFLYSKRVRNTFVEPWSTKRARQAAEAERMSRATVLAALAAQSREAAVAQPAYAEAAVAQPEAGPPAYAEAAVAQPAYVPPVWPAPPAGEAAPPRRNPRILLIPVVGILVIIVGLVAGLGAWRLANPPASANAVTVVHDASGNELKHYVNAEQKFAFDYPADWALQVSGQASQGFQLMVFDPTGHKVNAHSVDGVVVMAVTLPVVVGAEDIAGIRTSTEARFQELGTTGAKLLQPSSAATVNGLAGFTLKASEPAPDGGDLIYPLYFLFRNDRMYYLAAQSYGEPSAELEQEEQAIVDSFKATQ